MAYAVPQDLIDRYGSEAMRLLSDVGTPALGAPNVALMQTVLDDASALIDGYLVGRYALPLAVVPSALKVHCCGLARYMLMTRKPDERAMADQEAALAWLSQVAQSKIALMPPDQVPAAPGDGEVVFVGGQKIFGRDPLPGRY